MNNQTLELSDGLNILQAPNETVTSTWYAFLTAMLYGVSERDTAGFTPEIDRPWLGASTRGRMDCLSEGRELTLLRETKRQTAPMGAFKAVLSGTGDPAPGLTGANCGETLIGVPREVFERRALIRQAGPGVTADRELERRVSSLIPSGEGDVLKSPISAAQSELAEVRRTLSDLRDNQQTLASTRREAETLKAQLVETEAALEQWRSYRSKTRRRERENARAALEETVGRARALRQEIEAERLPEMSAIANLRSAAVNLQAAQRSMVKAVSQKERAEVALRAAEAALAESPLAGKTPEEAEAAPLDIGPKPKYPLWVALLCLLAGAALGGALWYAGKGPLLAFGCGCGLFGGTSLTAGLLSGRKAGAWEAKVADLRRERSAQVEAYTSLYNAAADAKAEADAKASAVEALDVAIASGEQAILREARKFAPSAGDIPSADLALRQAAARRKALSAAEAEANAAKARLEVLAQQPEDDAGESDGPARPPDRPQAALAGEAEELRRRLAGLQSRMDHLTGQIAAAGDPAALSAREERLVERIGVLTREYQAIAMASAEGDNGSGQGRPSPALSQRAAEIFSELTGGQYGDAGPDQALRLPAEALDQLYLAVGLANYELALPPEKAVPLILDDALANFDDQRRAAALRWLRREAENRQILLFTRHGQEAAFFRDDGDVRVQTLTLN